MLDKLQHMKSIIHTSQRKDVVSKDAILEHTSGCAFVVGFLIGFTTAKEDVIEPELEEIEQKYDEASKDSVLAIKPGS